MGRAERLEISSEPFRAAEFHWKEGSLSAAWRNPMSTKSLVHNFPLWSLPNSESNAADDRQAGRLDHRRRPAAHAHPPAERGVHAADFAEYAYLYERAWTGFPIVRMLLGHVPTFLMFDDHEVTDDWNFDVAWVRMLHNEKDEFRMWPKTLTDALAAYWVYQGWCNKAPATGTKTDPRIVALANARRTGTDALPELRRVIHTACFMPVPTKDPKRRTAYQTGLSLDWHYRLPFDPPFFVPDCRTRRLMVPADDKMRHNRSRDRRQGVPIADDRRRQLAWMRSILVDKWRGGPGGVHRALDTAAPEEEVHGFMKKPEIAAGAWARGTDVAGVIAAVFDSTSAAVATDAILHVFSRGRTWST